MDEALYEGHTIDELILILFRLIALFGLAQHHLLYATSISFSYNNKIFMEEYKNGLY